MATWAAEEFSGAEKGDGRLNRRLIKLAATFADKPTASIPGACPDWADTHAVCRSFDQAGSAKCALGWQDIHDPRIARSEARVRQHPVVLCLQGTTELDFNEDIGHYSPTKPRGECTSIRSKDEMKRLALSALRRIQKLSDLVKSFRSPALVPTYLYIMVLVAGSCGLSSRC